jgi:hypothetical protein
MAKDQMKRNEQPDFGVHGLELEIARRMDPACLSPGSETILAPVAGLGALASPGPYILLRTTGLAQPAATEASGLVPAEVISAADGGASP